MAVRWATRPDQQTIVGTLGDLAARIEQVAMKPPATIVIGEGKEHVMMHAALD
jgi:uroporphyrinogen III methyltransferase/synthase